MCPFCLAKKGHTRTCNMGTLDTIDPAEAKARAEAKREKEQSELQRLNDVAVRFSASQQRDKK